ncbi:MAG: RNB domain-containing ribonuclease [Sutterella sp.]|nr:RNB domain-containing ribonuclease [Sutterella sp.]
MNLYFEEDGAFKAGTILSQAGTAYQVELVTGRRSKVKAANAFFEFASPSAAELTNRIPEAAAELDPAFLWEAAPDTEFGYADLAAEYWGEGAGPVERAALLTVLHGNPVYFYRKGRGVYKRAPADILKKALEAVERRRQQEEQRRAWAAEMTEGRLPEAIGRMAMTLLVSPDKNGIEWKALSDAASATRQTPLKLLLALGAIASPYAWHVDSFYAENFPKGAGFPADLPAPEMGAASELPKAEVEAFSIDDSETTEIDDAVSVTHLEDGRTRIGIHIAAPAYGIRRDDAMDRVARARMSTVYAPGIKTTMLPDAWVAAFSLDEGREVPALSLYVTVSPEHEILETETKLERLAVAKNIRYDKLEHPITDEAIEAGTLEAPFAEALTWLWHFARTLQKGREEVRGRPEPVGRIDWSFALEGEGEAAKVSLKGRRRGEPLDLIVSELMILANSTWGAWLEEEKTAGIYRSQRIGRVRMSTTPAPHEGLGVSRYAWSTSPLRRYVDLINQRQLLGVVTGEGAAYAGNDADLFTIVSQFENLYGIYGDFQSRMERYWSLRWIEQEGLRHIEASVIKPELVRLEHLPFVHRVPGLPEDLERGRRVTLDVLGMDYLELALETRLSGVSDEIDQAELMDEDDAEDAEGAEGAENAPEGTAADVAAEASAAEPAPAN